MFGTFIVVEPAHPPPEAVGMLIATGQVPQDALKGDVAVVTGAGRGIGFEAARSLLWLGCRVVLAEINEADGAAAAARLEAEFGGGRVLFVRTDVGDEAQVTRLAGEAVRHFSKVDIVLNNATVFPIGSVKEKPIEAWDGSYRVNLRGPVLLARALLPGMLERRHGVFVCVSSSGAAPYMGPYEVFKTAQVELASTLAAELEGTGVHAFTIGPGIVRTPGFLDGGGQVAARMGMTIDDLLKMNEKVLLTPEAAGAGFAAAVALATRYDGQETSSIQVLRDAGIAVTAEPGPTVPGPLPVSRSALDLYGIVRTTYLEQSEGWKQRNLFERQWVYRDFRKVNGMSVEEMRGALDALGEALRSQGPVSGHLDSLNRLRAYYVHQEDLLKGFEKDGAKLKDSLALMDGWIRSIDDLVAALGATPAAAVAQPI